MGNVRNSAGKRIFDDIYSFPQDSQDLADDIWAADNVRIGTAAERGAVPAGYLRDGMLWVETDTGRIIKRLSGGWVPLNPRIGMSRANTAVSISNTVFQDLSTGANWTEAFRSEFATYADGVVVPVTGPYTVSYAVTASAAFLAGVTINKATSVTLTDLRVPATGLLAQGVAVATTSQLMSLNAGDKIRLFGIASAGGTNWRTEAGMSSFQVQLA